MRTDKYPAIGTTSSVPGMSDVFHFGSSDRVGKPSLTRNMLGLLRKELSHFLPAGVRTGVRSVQHAHDEAAFRFLLTNEVNRSMRSGRSFHILLVYLSEPEGGTTTMDGKVRNTVLPVLSSVLRETDYIGWYRADCVLGGVLTALEAHSPEEVSARIEQRFWRKIGRDFQAEQLACLRVRFISSEEVDCTESIDRVFFIGQRG